MLYKELYKESNELAKERFVLVRERVERLKKSRRQKKNIKNTSGRRHSCCRNRRLSMIYGQMMRFKNRV